MGTPFEPEATGPETPGVNPAWNDLLSTIPEDIHEQVTPVLQKWDQSVQKKIEDANKALAEWEPYKPLREHGIDMGLVQEGLQLHHTLMNSPLEIYRALRDSYDFSDEESEEEEPEEPSANIPKEFQQTQAMTRQLAEWVLQQEESKKNAAEDAKLDSALNAAKQKYGDFDEAYVLSQMANKDLDVDAAVEQYQQFVQGILQANPRPFAPRIMGGSASGSGYPTQQQINPTKLNREDTKKLVAQYMEAAAREQ